MGLFEYSSRYLISNAYWYLQFVIPVRFKNEHKLEGVLMGVSWWMYFGKCFNIKYY